jgi:DNA-binding IclR family transcriptional regulator
MSEDGGVRSVGRAFDILALIVDRPAGVSLQETIAATRLPKTTVLRLLQTLEQHGLVWTTETQRYLPGPALLHAAAAAADIWRLPVESAQNLENLALACHETVNIWVRRGLQRVCVAQASANRSLRHVIQVGDRMPLDSGAAARVLLTAVDDATLDDVVATSTRDRGELAGLAAAVALTRTQGWSVSHGEREEGLSAISVPIRSKRGDATAALTLSGPTSRFGSDRLQEFIAALQTCAEQLAARGFGPREVGRPPTA